MHLFEKGVIIFFKIRQLPDPGICFMLRWNSFIVILTLHTLEMGIPAQFF
jgi:hypothetical protein